MIHQVAHTPSHTTHIHYSNVCVSVCLIIKKSLSHIHTHTHTHTDTIEYLIYNLMTTVHVFCLLLFHIHCSKYKLSHLKISHKNVSVIFGCIHIEHNNVSIFCCLRTLGVHTHCRDIDADDQWRQMKETFIHLSS